MPIPPDLPARNDSRLTPANAGDPQPTGTGAQPTTTARGLERAVESGHLPPETTLPSEETARADAVHVGIPDLARAELLARRLAAREGALDLIAGRYPEAVSLSSVLRGAAEDPRSRAAIKKILSDFEGFTGIRVPEALVNAVLANPARIVDVLAVTPKELALGFDRLVELYQQGLIRDAAPKPARLPQGFDLKDAPRAAFDREAYVLKELAPGLFQGDIASDLAGDRAKTHMVLAEAFDRLAENASKPRNQRFRVRYDGGEYTRLDRLVRALVRAGHTIDVTFGHRIANFADLKTKAPDGRFLDVPAALLIRTGVQSPGGEIVLPAAHAEMTIRITSHADTRGPRIDGVVKFFQGMSATGFFPGELAVTPRWLGYAITDRLQGEDAAKAIELAGLLSDVINAVAREERLPYGAYGVTGICMDSVEVVRHAITGRIGYYPLLMRDRLLFPKIAERLADPDHRDDPEYRRLASSIDAVPSDVDPNPSQRERMLASIPWAAGEEPFPSVVDARAILANA